MTATATETAAATITIQRVGTKTVLVPIIGTAPLLMHKFSEKAKRQMLDNMQGKKSVKTVRNPQKDFEEAAYRTDDGGYGFPTIGFKAATVSASRFFGKSAPMTHLRQSMFFDGEFSKIEGQKLTQIVGPDPILREDVVRVGMGGTDLRYRPEFREWSATLQVSFVSSMLSLDSVLSLIEAGGMGVGVGEWRPEKKGDFGTYAIDPDAEHVVIG